MRARTRAPVASEDQVKSSIYQWLQLRRYWRLRVNAGLTIIEEPHRRAIRHSPGGTPDIIFGLPYGSLTLLAFIEAKRSHGGVQSDKQKEFQAEMDARGICYILAASVDDVQLGIARYLTQLDERAGL